MIDLSNREGKVREKVRKERENDFVEFERKAIGAGAGCMRSCENFVEIETLFRIELRSRTQRSCCLDFLYTLLAGKG